MSFFAELAKIRRATEEEILAKAAKATLKQLADGEISVVSYERSCDDQAIFNSRGYAGAIPGAVREKVVLCSTKGAIITVES